MYWSRGQPVGPHALVDPCADGALEPGDHVADPRLDGSRGVAWALRLSVIRDGSSQTIRPGCRTRTCRWQPADPRPARRPAWLGTASAGHARRLPSARGDHLAVDEVRPGRAQEEDRPGRVLGGRRAPGGMIVGASCRIFSGMPSAISTPSFTKCSPPSSEAAEAVSTNPKATAFTFTLNATPSASVFVRPTRPAFAAGSSPGQGCPASRRSR